VTTVAGSTLLVNGSITNNTINVTGGVLGGLGVVGAVNATAGQIYPGSPLGAASILTSGNVALATGATYVAQLNSNLSLNLLNVLGNLNLDSNNGLGSSLTGNLAAGYRPAINTSFTLVTTTGGTITGQFKGIPEGGTAIIGGLPFRVHYTANAITVTRIQALSALGLSSSANPSVFGQPVTFTALVSPVAPVTAIPTGQVVFTIDNVAQPGANIDPLTGKATISLTNLTVGMHTFSASYAGDADFTGSNSGAAQIQTVNRASTTTAVTADSNPAVYGQSVTFTITVAAQAPSLAIPQGLVTVTFDGTAQAAQSVNGTGKATFSPPLPLAVGTHTVTVSYAGNGNFVASSTTTTFNETVNQDGTNIANVTATPVSSVYGQTVKFSTAVTAAAPGAGTPSGTVSFFDAGTFLGTGSLDGTGKASFTTNAALTVGQHTITASYSGDTNFLGSTSAGATTENVAQASTTTATVIGNPSTSVYGQAVTFTTTVSAMAPGSGTPSGTVTFKDGLATLGTAALDATGKATFTTTNPLVIGSHLISAVYAGDTNFLGSVTLSSFTELVNPDNSTISVVSSAQPSVFGQAVTLTVTIGAAAPGSGTPTGTVILTLDSNPASPVALDVNGKASLSASSLSVGTHTVKVFYVGDSNFNSSNNNSSPFVQTVNKADTTTGTVQSSTNPSVFTQLVTFTTTVTVNSPGAGAPSGMVQFFDNGTSLGSAPLLSGTASLTTSAAQGGSRSITATYSGDGSFNSSTTASPLIQTVNKADSTTSAVLGSLNAVVFGQTITFSVKVAAQAPATGSPSGIVTFFDGTTAIGSGTISGGSAAFAETTQLAAGSHSITASYAGDGNFNGSSNSSGFSVTVSQDGTTTAVSSSANPSVFSQSVTFTATVTASSPGSGIPTGQIVFTIDGTAQSPVALSAGKATLSTGALAGGTHAITASYNGDTNFTASDNTASPFSQVVNMANSTVSLGSSAQPSVFGQSVTFTVTVAAAAPAAGTPTGTVIFKLDGIAQPAVTLGANDQATFTPATTLSVGPHTITATYSGDTNFNGSSAAPFSQIVGQASTVTTAVTAAPISSVFGQAVTFTTTVSALPPGAGTPGGTVSFFDNGTLLGSGSLANGSASFTTTATQLAVGSNHVITATYLGNANFLASTSPATSYAVARASTTTTVSGAPLPSVFGQAVTFTATVSAVSPGSGTPSGVVTFLDGTTALGTGTLSGGKASFTTSSALSVGTHNITASYGGDGSFSASATAAPFAQTVNQADTITATVSAIPMPSVFGQSVIFSTTVTAKGPGAGTPTGSVTFLDGGTTLGTGTLSAGTASITTASLAVGSHSITAVYTGDVNFNGSSTSAPATQTVNKASATVAVGSSVNPSVFGQQLSFTAAVTAQAPGAGTPSGSVTFNVDGTTTTVNLDNTGKASLSVSSLGKGSHTISATYRGDGNFNSSSTTSPLTQTVGQASTATIASTSASTTAFGQAVTFSATVSAQAPGAGTPTGTVTFFDAGISIGTGTLTGGKATFSTTLLTVGSHAITASYGGDTNFTGSTTAASVTQTVIQASTTLSVNASRTFVISGRPVTFTATVAALAPGAGSPTGSVQFLDGAVLIGSAPLVGNSATLATAFTAGGHVITASYGGDASFSASTSPAPITVTVATLNQAFVAQVYLDVLRRPVDGAGLANWSHLLDIGQMTRTQVVRTIETSTEYKQIEVIDAFHKLLHRNVDAGGLTGFTSYLQSGATVEQLDAVIAGSQEYYINRGGGTDAGWLGALAQDTVGHPFDLHTQSVLLLLLQQFTPRSSVALSALRGQEAEFDLVATYYPEFLHRPGDGAGIQGYVNAILAGALRQEDVIAAIVGSQEYFNNL